MRRCARVASIFARKTREMVTKRVVSVVRLEHGLSINHDGTIPCADDALRMSLRSRDCPPLFDRPSTRHLRYQIPGISRPRRVTTSSPGLFVVRW